MHSFKKSFGQNFLRGDKFAHKLVDALDLQPSDTVIEVGPGDGRVTNILLKKGAKVTSVEVDYDLIPNLIKRFGDAKNFELLNEDILQTDIEMNDEPYKVTGSLPYNISKQIIKKFLEAKHKPTSMTFIVQEEVAKNYVAKPPKATFLSNWSNTLATVKKLETISASQFLPKPKVNGAILRFLPSEVAGNQKELAKLMHIGFKMPRKTLSNNLKSSGRWEQEELDSAWGTLKLKPKVRPAELEFEDWQGLAKVLIK